MAGTTAFDVKQALVDKLRLLPALAEMAANGDIWYAYQGRTSTTPRSFMWAGEIEWRSEEGASLGALKREEYYEIVLTIESHMMDATQEEANARVRTFMTVVEAMLRDPRWSGVPGVFETGLEPKMLGEGTDPNGRGAILVCTVCVKARK